jgi:CHAT domain-containing protein/Tfp pilus assembly protein PilF
MPRQARLSGIALMLVLMGGQFPVLAQHNSSPNFPRPGNAAPSSERTNSLERANALNQQVVELYQAGRYDEAILLAAEVLRIRETVLGPNHLDVATSLNNLALLYEVQGNYDAAEPLYQRSLRILETTLDPDHPDVATSLNNLAVLYEVQGNYSAAEPLHQRALRIRETALGPNHLDVATSLNNLALLYEVQGNYDAAEPLYQRSLRILETTLGSSHPRVASSLSNLAGLYRAQGDYGTAEPLYQRSLRILEVTLEPNHPSVAQSLNNLAVLYRVQGNYSAAESLYQRALRIWETALGPDHPNVAASLNNLAELYRTQGNYGAAQPLFLRALRIRETALGPDHPDVAQSLNNLAGLYRAQGNYGAAEPLYQRALGIREAALGLDHPDVAQSLNNLAVLYQIQGNYGAAESLYQQSLDTFEVNLGPDHPNVTSSLNNLAVLYEAQGNVTEAVRFLARGLEIEELNLDLNLAILADAQRQAYVATISGTTNHALSLNLQSAPMASDATQLALTTLLRRKGRILDAGTNSWQGLRQNLSTSDQATFDEFIVIRQELARLTFNPPAQLSPEQYRAELNRLETTANRLESQLARRSAVFRAETQPVEIVAVQAQIPADGVLVEYVRYLPFDATNTSAPWGAPRYAAYLLFPNGDIQAVDLGDAAEIDAAIQAFSLRLRDITQSPSAAARALSAQILDPIQPYLTGREHLLISPDSQLNRIPFEALRTADNRYLVQDYQISYLNSGRDLLKFNVTEPSTVPAVIVANPDYEVADASIQIASTRSSQRSAELSQLQFGPLPGTAAEAEAIQQYLPNAEVLTADQATENTLKQTEAPRILHIATHGFFLANVDRPEGNDSRGLVLVTADNTPGSPPQVAVENPLLRSGLALAGFNSRSSGSEDGVLTALEASTLNLFGTQLVVLSACDTGLGDIANGEGVYGLRRAFAIAGAESQLLSLWQVDDFGTQSLMARYYENLTAGMGRSGALRAVQLEMIDSQSRYAHPYYWAAFILAGDWQPLAE